MSRRNPQRGSSLIMLIGVIAALAIMATTLVALIANVQHNTYADRMEVKADTVTEAALDVGMADLSAAVARQRRALVPTLNPTGLSRHVRGRPVPRPQERGLRDLHILRQPAVQSPYSASNPPDYDDNDDSRMYLVSQAKVGPGAARMQALVEITYFKARLSARIAVFTGANLISNGGGNNPKITVEVAPATRHRLLLERPAPSKRARPARTRSTTPRRSSALKARQRGPSRTPSRRRSSARSSTAARSNGRYFDGATAITDAENSPAKGSWSDGGLTGLTVIEPDTSTQTLTASRLDSTVRPTPGDHHPPRWLQPGLRQRRRLLRRALHAGYGRQGPRQLHHARDAGLRQHARHARAP